MRILTVRQPWAWALIHAGKDVENRTRNIAGAYRGPVAIHAGLTAVDYDDALWDRHLFRNALLTSQPDSLSAMDVRGAILGVVDLVDVHPVFDCIEQQRDGDWHVCSSWAERAGWHLVVANARYLTEPIAYRGGLGLRRLDEETASSVREAIA